MTALLAIYGKLTKLAMKNGQVIGEKGNYYVTLEQLEIAMKCEDVADGALRDAIERGLDKAGGLAHFTVENRLKNQVRCVLRELRALAAQKEPPPLTPFGEAIRRNDMDELIMQAVPEDHPLMKAWHEYRNGSTWANTLKWALNEHHVEGSLWAAFEHGYRAAQKEPGK